VRTGLIPSFSELSASRSGTPAGAPAEPFAVRRLFDGAAAPRSIQPTLFDSSPGFGEGSSRGLFAEGADTDRPARVPGDSDDATAIDSNGFVDPAQHARAETEAEQLPPRPSDIFSTVRPQEPSPTAPARGPFGDNTREAEPWPWAISLIKPQ
jgi:hypothetical protein